MDTQQKLAQLSQQAQYDLSCACGTRDEDRRQRKSDGLWVYPASLPRGGKGIILKTLLSDACVNDCKYCPLRTNQDTRRCTLTPDEIANVTIDYVRRKNIIGLFLSSGVIKNPDFTMERLCATAELLRYRHHYRGFIHLKVIPGASDAAITRAVSLASCVSLNVEAPTAARFGQLSDRKNFQQDIVRPIQLISDLTARGSRYSRVHQSTQFIVGASDEIDREIVEATSRLYSNLKLNRVYFSAYQRGLGDQSLPGENSIQPGPELLTREHRLYQTDFLIRKYKFKFDEIPFTEDGNLRIDIDPKLYWAQLHPEFFPVRINSARKTDLLKVPGIGPTYAKRIINTRKTHRLTSLRDIGMKGKPLTTAAPYTIAE